MCTMLLMVKNKQNCYWSDNIMQKIKMNHRQTWYARRDFKVKVKLKNALLWTKSSIGLRVWLGEWAWADCSSLDSSWACSLGPLKVPSVLMSKRELNILFHPRKLWQWNQVKISLWGYLSVRSQSNQDSPIEVRQAERSDISMCWSNSFSALTSRRQQIFLENLESPIGMFLRCNTPKDSTWKTSLSGVCLALSTVIFRAAVLFSHLYFRV